MRKGCRLSNTKRRKGAKNHAFGRARIILATLYLQSIKEDINLASITFKNVKKIYDNSVTVIPDLNIEIKDKEFVILVGPSGCGKSTTL